MKDKPMTRALDWSEYLKLLDQIRLEMQITNSADKAKVYNSFHTLVLIAGHYHVPATDLLSLTWNDLLKNEGDPFPLSKGIQLIFTKELLVDVQRNYQFAQPGSNDDLILHKKGLPKEKVRNSQFNSQFARILAKTDIRCDKPQYIILRKTFALKHYKDNGADHNALRLTSKVLGHFSLNQTREFLDIEKT